MKKGIDWWLVLLFAPLAIALGMLTAYSSKIGGALGDLMLAIEPLLFIALFVLVIRLRTGKPTLSALTTRNVILVLMAVALTLAAHRWLGHSMWLERISNRQMLVFVVIPVLILAFLVKYFYKRAPRT